MYLCLEKWMRYMEVAGFILFYIAITLVYACVPEQYRPSTFIGWSIFILMTIFMTPVISIPITVAACYYLGPIYGE